MSWISVKDELPPEGEHILVYDDGVGTGFFLPRDLSAIASGDPAWSKLTHWQPLPEPPENDNDS